MLKLHGFSLSNYYNKVKLALLEKSVPFADVLVPTDPWLAADRKADQVRAVSATKAAAGL